MPKPATASGSQSVSNKITDSNPNINFANDFKWIGITTLITVIILVVAYIVIK